MECDGYSAEEVLVMAEKLNTQFILPVNPDKMPEGESIKSTQPEDQTN